MNKKEVYCLLGTIGAVPLLMLLFFGFDTVNPEAAIDINIHDTYFVIAHLHLLFMCILLVLFTVYFLRSIYLKFKNNTVNLILMLATAMLILVHTKAIGMLDILIAPTFSSSAVGEENQPGNVLAMISKALFLVQIALLGLLAYCGFRTGQNYKS